MSGQQLYYKIAVPNNQIQSSRTILILLHGRGSDENDLLELSNYLDSRLVIVSIRAPHKYQFGGYTWFDLDEKLEADCNQIIKSAILLRECIGNIKELFQLNFNKIFLMGFSMGAMMAFVNSLLFPNLCNGVIAHSGFLPKSENLKYEWDKIDNLSYYMAHGIYDQTIPLTFAKSTLQLLQEKKANVTYQEYPIAHSISEESIRDINIFLERFI